MYRLFKHATQLEYHGAYLKNLKLRSLLLFLSSFLCNTTSADLYRVAAQIQPPIHSTSRTFCYSFSLLLNLYRL